MKKQKDHPQGHEDDVGNEKELIASRADRGQRDNGDQGETDEGNNSTPDIELHEGSDESAQSFFGHSLAARHALLDL